MFEHMTEEVVEAGGAEGDAGYALDLPAEIAAKYRGRPALLATALLSAEMVDLTKPLPPAATADEEALDAVMKRISPAFTAVRLAIDASNADSARQGAVVLNQAFAEVDAFWTRQARADAVSWAQTARVVKQAHRGHSQGSDQDPWRGPVEVDE